MPKYLQQYKHEAEELEKKRQELKEKRKLPPGTRLVPEEERIQTLEDLTFTKAELQKLLGQMPISLRSEGLQKKKRELEERLEKVEQGINMFSRKVVYVKEN